MESNLKRVGLFQAHRDGLMDSDICFPLWQGYLKSYYERYGRADRVKIVFVNTVQELKDNKFDIIALSSTSIDYCIVTELAIELKSLYNPYIILGGYHVSTLPHSLHSAFDYGVMGEGEQTFLEILNALLDGTPSIPELEQIKGLAFHDNGDIIINPPREEIIPLDKIPNPERSVKYQPATIVTSRGCHFHCTFCANARTWKKVRYFSANHVIEELQQIISAWEQRDDSENVNKVVFYDDLAVANRQRLKEIVRQIESLGINKKLRFVMNARAELVDDELADLFKRMNVYMTQLGLESGTDRILKGYKGITASVATNQRALDILHKAGILVFSCFIIGYFDETIEEIKETMCFILRNIEEDKLLTAQIATLAPLPGTAVWKQAIAKNFVSEDLDWNRLRHMPMSFRFYDSINSFDQLFEERARNRTIFLSEKISESELKSIMQDFYAKYEPLVRKKEEEQRKKRKLEIFSAAQRILGSDEIRKQGRIVVYGAGECAQNFLELIPDDCKNAVIGIIDRDQSKHGSFINGIQIYSPDELLSLSPHTIIIGSLAFSERIERNIRNLYAGINKLPAIIKLEERNTN